MKFSLVEKGRIRMIAKFHVVDQSENVVGSVNVKVEDADDLLRHWVGSSSPQPKTTNLPAREQSPVSALATAFMKNRKPFRQEAILRGCNG